MLMGAYFGGLDMTDTTRESVEAMAQTLDHHAITQYGANSSEAATLRALLTRAEELEASLLATCQRETATILRWESRLEAAEAKLAVAVQGLRTCAHGGLTTLDKGNKARAALATLTADTIPDPRIEGWNAAIEAAASNAEEAASRYELKDGKVPDDCKLATSIAWEIFRAIRAIPCPYQLKEKDDDT